MNGSVTFPPSSSTVSYAVVIIADLISAGVAFGCSPRYSSARPATCGAAIEVPERSAKVGSSPSALLVAAMIETPGAVTSGFRMSLPSASTGPRELKPATWGVGAETPVVLSGTSVTVAPGVAA